MANTKVPWKQANPKKTSARKSLTPAQKASARAAAKDAGRPYPNLIDNMRAARKASVEAVTKAAKQPVKKSAGNAAKTVAGKAAKS